MNYNTKYKSDLEKKFNDKNISGNSIKLYIRNLEKLNNDEPLKNLNFLSPMTDIINKLTKYKPNTFRGYLISICSVLHMQTTKKFKTLYNEYYDLLMKTNKDLKDKEKLQEKTKTQEDNWITWNDVSKRHEELKDMVDTFKNSKELNKHKYDILLEYVILSLYFFTPPKRNQDWSLMNIIYKATPDLVTTHNYLDYSTQKFIFNKYKTSKTKGELIEDIPDKLMSVINLYLKFHPLLKGKKITKNTNEPFLVFYDGSDFKSINSITRILNKIFDKKIGSSMLRHIYVTDKFGDNVKQMKETANSMGHSVETQIDTYIKK